MMKHFSFIFYFCLVGLIPTVLISEEEKKTPEEILEERESNLEGDDIKGLLGLASYAKSNKLPDDAERLYEEVLAIDPFDKRAHKGLGHVQLYDVWITKEERDDFKDLLKEEKKDKAISTIKKLVFNNNTQIGRDALKKMGSMSQALVIDIAYKQMFRSDDVFMVDIAMDIFHGWCGEMGRDIWIRKISRDHQVGEAVHCLDLLKDNLSERKDDPLTAFLLKELYRNRNQTISLKVLELLAQIPTEEVLEAMTKFLPRANNQMLKQKIMELIF